MPWTRFRAPTYVTSLPSSPKDNQEIYYAADATNGVIWHLRYRAASSSSYKWEYLGGPPLETALNAETGPVSITGATWGDISTQIAVTAPLAGDYAVTAQTSVTNTTVTNHQIGITKDTTDGVFVTYIQTTVSANWCFISCAAIVTDVGASKKLALRFRPDATGNMYRKGSCIRVVPVRVG